MLSKVIKILKQNKGFIIFIFLMSIFRSAVADWNIVPSGSMEPTIEIGDRLWINKLAYDIQVPFIYKSIYRHSNPERSDIVIFESNVTGMRMVKRVVGLPGDTFRMENNQVVLNGETLSYDLEVDSADGIILNETLDSNEHLIRLEQLGSVMSDFPEIKIPEGYYFVLGDNRDNSNDSRFISFIPRDEIIGRTSTVVISHDFDKFYLPKAGRFFKAL